MCIRDRDSLSEGNYFFKAFKKYINTPYQKLLIWCIQHPIKTLSTAGILFLGSLLLVPVLGFSLFPESEKPIITIDIETEPGTNLLQTDKVVRKIEKQILKLPEVSHISANVGKGNPRIYYNEFQKQNAANIGQILSLIHI